MFRPKAATCAFVAASVVLAVVLLYGQQTQQSEREAMYRRYLEFPSYVRGGSITPHWMADGSSFWYAEGAPANTVIYKVNPAANTKTALFDTGRLRRALAEWLGHQPPYQGLPFSDFTFLDGETAVKFTVEDKEFVLQLATYTITQAPAVSEAEKNRLTPQAGEVLSPDGRWFAGVKDHNLWLRSTDDGRSVQITADGLAGYAWGDWPWESKQIEWSADSSKLAVKKLDIRQVPKIPLVHYLKPTEEVEWVPYTGKASAPAEETELFIIDILSKQQVRVETGDEPGQLIFMLEWRPNGSEMLFLRADRYLGRTLEVMAANPATGSTRVVLSETNEAPVDLYSQQPFTLLGDGKGFIWLSQRSGWRHLYLYDMNGRLIRQLTEGEFPVVRVAGVDEKAGWIYFTAQGDRRRVYDTHLYRVSMEGRSLTRLTEAPGQHDFQVFRNFFQGIQLAPSKEVFLDTHSTTARPPTVELRRADGTLLQTLAKADVEGLKELKWTPPEEFVVKAADGRTDLYGVLYKPYDFDPRKKYPVIEFIHGGMSRVPRTFAGRPGREEHWLQAMAQLGFVTFVVDGRGPWIEGAMGSGFERVAYGSWGRYEIPDHVATLKQLAEKRAYIDLSRVGVIGFSMGGYYAVRALLQAPDDYHVGIAVAPVIEISEHLNYRWLGPPERNKEAYEYASNLPLASNLKGKLLLIHGTNDDAVPFSHTMRMVEALMRAGKPYDLIVLPEWGHWWNIETREKQSYRLEAYRRYFQEHLRP